MQEKLKPKQGQVFVKFHVQTSPSGFDKELAVTVINEGETSVFVDALRIMSTLRDAPVKVIQFSPSTPVGVGAHETWTAPRRGVISDSISVEHTMVEVVTSPSDVSVRMNEGEFVAAYLKILPKPLSGYEPDFEDVPS